MLQVQGVSYRYPGKASPTVLAEVSFSLEPGSLTALLGPNGAGKSTLLKLLLGQLSPSQGKLVWSGQAMAPRRPRLALVPQRSAIQWQMPITVWDLVALGTLAAPAAEPLLDIPEALQSMGLASLADTRLSQLSGGQQQRALLARALVQKADLLLLDEPFTYLDPPTRQQLLVVLRQQAAQGRIVLVSSHDWGDSLQGYDRALLLDTTLRADDRPDRVLERLQRP
ncbi:MAG: ATP-binding cassette domain-containing protein [Cyanobacteria bacterium]|jgi:zinc/manganese transport system ATP-binding protein|nr:ATP-binding cassette domain-containing protein [Cyanobacteriota bacterium]